MARQIGTYLLCFIFLVYTCGCAGTKVVSTAEFEKEPQRGITSVVLNDGTRVEFIAFQGETGSYVDGEIVGVTRTREKVHIPIAQVREISYNDAGHSSTAVLVGIGLIAVGAIVYWLSTFELEFSPHR